LEVTIGSKVAKGEGKEDQIACAMRGALMCSSICRREDGAREKTHSSGEAQPGANASGRHFTRKGERGEVMKCER